MTAKKIPRTYRLKPEIIQLIDKAFHQSNLTTMTALVETAIIEYSKHLLHCDRVPQSKAPMNKQRERNAYDDE